MLVKRLERGGGSFNFPSRSLRNWRDLAHKSFCFGGEVVNASGEEPERIGEKSRKKHGARPRFPPAAQAIRYVA